MGETDTETGSAANADAPNVNMGVAVRPKGWRKFTLAAFASISAGLLCWYAKLDGQQWVWAQSLVLGLYGGSNVIDKRLGGAG